MPCIILLFASLSFSCDGITNNGNSTSVSLLPGKDTTNLLTNRITLDADGDGIPETIEIIMVKEANGNPMEDGESAEYGIRTENDKIPFLTLGCCEGYLLSEGDLNKNGGAELSLIQAPLNGCTYTLVCYTYDGSAWKMLMDPILIPTACDGLSKKALEDRIILEGGSVYYYENDPNSETGELLRKQAVF